MSPDDLRFMAGSYIIKTTNFTSAFGGTQQILSNDPSRWGVMICNGAPPQVSISPLASVTGADGIIVNNTNPIVDLNVRDHASLPMVEWFAFMPAFSAVTVIEICLA